MPVRVTGPLPLMLVTFVSYAASEPLLSSQRMSPSPS